MRASLEDLRSDSCKQPDARHKRSSYSQNQTMNILTRNVIVVDFVLICKPTKRTQKLDFLNWFKESDYRQESCN